MGDVRCTRAHLHNAISNRKTYELHETTLIAIAIEMATAAAPPLAPLAAAKTQSIQKHNGYKT